MRNPRSGSRASRGSLGSRGRAPGSRPRSRAKRSFYGGPRPQMGGFGPSADAKNAAEDFEEQFSAVPACDGSTPREASEGRPFGR